MARRRVPVSVVSVWNDESVRSDCLDRSLEAGRDSAPDLEYLPVDNRGQPYATAGAALNYGVRAATCEVIAFIQQDIYLHSLPALEEAAGLLVEDPGIGLVGAVGIDRHGSLRGRIRDRVALVGTPAASPVEVDSLDEVLFLARREDLLASPLCQDADLAWHAYAVEYGLRQRARGRSVVAIDIPLSHNSLSTNLARLDVAHAGVARRHPDAMPLHTTCGLIAPDVDAAAARPSPTFLSDHRWRYRWAKGSVAARRGQRSSASPIAVLADLRRDIDRVADASPGGMRIHNLVPKGRAFAEEVAGTRLRRSGYDVHFTSGTLEQLPDLAAVAGTTVVTNLEPRDLVALRRRVAGIAHVLGYHDDLGYWMVFGQAAGSAADIWADRRNRPARLPL